MNARLTLAGAFLCVALTNAHATTWHFEISSPSLTGFFDVDASTFAIPISATNPSNINMTAADLVLNNLHFTPANTFIANCDPGQCVLDLESNTGVFLGLVTNPIWLPWDTHDSQFVAVSWVTPAGALSSENGSGVRTVEPNPTPLPATLPLFATGLGALGLLRLRTNRSRRGRK